jgi:CO dehydrogenase/acetyl-CoA synthase epsilon subunit
LRQILDVDNDVEAVAYRKKIFFTIAKNAEEYEKDVVPTGELVTKVRERGADVFTFLERGWVHTLSYSKSWVKGNDNIALLHVTSYDDWWKNIGKKTRNVIRKAEKSGVKTRVVEPDEKLAEGIWKIYNETPIRQDRAFPHYGETLDAITRGLHSTRNVTYIGAFLQDELAGFIQLVHGDRIVIISQILSLQKYWDKAVNNASVAKTVEVCASKHEEWLMYARMGNHPSLDKFKESNAFVKFPLARYYVPLTRRGRVALRLGLQVEMKDALPQRIKYSLIPFYNWISRTKVRIRLRLKT